MHGKINLKANSRFFSIVFHRPYHVLIHLHKCVFIFFTRNLTNTILAMVCRPLWAEENGFPVMSYLKKLYRLTTYLIVTFLCLPHKCPMSENHRKMHLPRAPHDYILCFIFLLLCTCHVPKIIKILFLLRICCAPKLNNSLVKV